MRYSFYLIFIIININAQQLVRLTSFGAIPNDNIEDTKSLIKALEYCSHRKAVLNIPEGKFIINSKERIEFNCDISGNGILLNLGNYFIIKNDNLKLSDITISGGIYNNIGKGIYVFGNNVTIDNVKLFNINQGAITSEGVNNLKIINCSIDNCKGVWGDGILLLRSTDCLVQNNTISNIQRIGIVADTNVPELKSKNVRIINNKVSNTINSLYGELNGGIWLEHTLNGVISDNSIENTNDRGIVIAPAINDNKKYSYFISNNTIKNTKYAIALSGEINNADFYIFKNTISGSFERGLTVGANFNKIILDECFFDGSKNKLDDFIAIYFDMYGAWRKSYLEIKANNRKSSLKNDILIHNRKYLEIKNESISWKL